MIVKNERANLERCLVSVADLVDEQIVVDTGSTDGTQDVARRFGATLVQSSWNRDFAAARNISLAHATGRWTLVLDADEWLEPPAKVALRALLAHHTPEHGAPKIAFNLIQKSTSDEGRTGITALLVRLFPRRPEVRYSWPIHEQIAPSLIRAGIPIHNSEIVILHSGYADPKLNLEKQRRNLAILEAQIASGQDVWPLTYFLAAGCHLDLGDPAMALSGYERCRELAQAMSGQEEIAAGARVRIAQCLAELKRYPEVIARTPPQPDATWHPELLTYRAQAEAATGQPDAACRAYEQIFGCPDQPRIPACNLARLKIEALSYLGEYWRQRHYPARAIALLRAGIALKNGASDFSAADLGQCNRLT